MWLEYVNTVREIKQLMAREWDQDTNVSGSWPVSKVNLFGTSSIALSIYII